MTRVLPSDAETVALARRLYPTVRCAVGEAEAEAALEAILAEALTLSAAPGEKELRQTALRRLGEVAGAECPQAVRSGSHCAGCQTSATRSDIRTLVQALPPPCRVVLALIDVGEFAVREVAGASGLSEGQVRGLLHRARRAIADAVP